MWTLIFILAIILGFAAYSYNVLQKLAQEVREKSSNCQVIISKKLSLINQLIDVVKNYQEGEQLVQLKVSNDNTTAAMMNAYQQSGSVLSTIQGMSERFPNLKANEQYHRLISNIEICEKEIQQTREKYNKSVKEYNTKRLGIPTIFIARSIGFSEAPYLQFDISGATDVTSLKEFKTDDGARLQELLSGAGNKIGSATKALANQAGVAGKLIAEKIKEKQSANYFYMQPGGAPNGPVTINEIRKLLDEGILNQETKLSTGGADWQLINDVIKEKGEEVEK